MAKEETKKTESKKSKPEKKDIKPKYNSKEMDKKPVSPSASDRPSRDGSQGEEEPKVEKDKRKYFQAVGRRKTSIARIRIYKGKGVFLINEKPDNEYLNHKALVEVIYEPLKLVNQFGKFDVSARVSGGGKRSQAEAIRHGLSRAILVFDPKLKVTLKKAGYLTRDSRMKERKKYGLKRARKAPQFTKR